VATAPEDPGEGSLLCFPTQAQASAYAATWQVSHPQSATSTAAASGSDATSAAVAAGGALPATGGGGVVILAGALLLGAGVMTYAIVRRTS